MSDLAKDTLDAAVRKVGRMKKPDWKSDELSGDQWEKVSKAMLKVLDEMKGHGTNRPLAKLQSVAFEESLVSSSEPLQTVALWLTDTRIRVERFQAEQRDEDRRILEKRGLLKSKKGAA